MIEFLFGWMWKPELAITFIDGIVIFVEANLAIVLIIIVSILVEKIKKIIKKNK